MYAAFFGLRQEPFSIAPDPRFLFMSERHREALAHLLYGLGSGGGFVLLSGDIGTGKTTVCRLFLEQVPANCNVAYIFNPKLTGVELLQSICDEFHVPVAQREAPTVKGYLDPLNDFLLKAHADGRNNVLVIDEAQNLSAEVLEQLRLLTNLETSERKLLQVVLIGQPELRDMLARPELEQLAQRVIARYHLGPLTPSETARYIQHRLDVAGLDRPLPFARRALRRIHQLSGGVPRRINLLCDRALLGAFANSRATVERPMVDKAAQEVFGQAGRPTQTAWRLAGAMALGLGLGAGLFALAGHLARPSSPAVAVSAMTSGKPPAAVPAPAAVADRPALLPLPRAGKDEAWRDLAMLWNEKLQVGPACEALVRKGLNCFSRRVDLAMIRQLGRPGILTLDAGSAEPVYALLVALGPRFATLQVDGTEQRIALAALAPRWRGEFSTLWRAPPADPPARSGVSLAWIAGNLPVPAGDMPPGEAAGPPEQVRARLLAFQKAQGLAPDGIAGPMTLMQLNRVAGVDEPRLRLDP